MAKISIILIILVFIYLSTNCKLWAAGVQDLDKQLGLQSSEEETGISLKPEAGEYTATDLRDPFKSYLVSEESSKVPQEELEERIVEQSLPSLIIEGIIWRGRFPQAIINHKVVKAEDEIEGVKILEISKDGIVVFYNNRRYKLSSPATTALEKLKQKPQSEGGLYETKY
ncbi:MAG: hypothetical protein NC928_03660 [Candidatus Omnitrophica bacterium]|nr:hypothetical protein [Candidatus Omnitrophota bacterium]